MDFLHKIFLPALILLSLILYFFYIFLDLSPIVQTQNFLGRIFFEGPLSSAEWPKRESVDKEWPPPLILSWNDFFNFGSTMNNLKAKYDVSKCPYSCHYSDNRSLETNASVLIFHIRNSLQPLPAHRLPHQLYAFFLLESPHHSGSAYRTEVPRDFFNITMTYRGDSDVPFPYDAFDRLEAEEGNGTAGKGEARKVDRWTEEEVRKKVEGKSKLALQFVSNCNTPSRREKLVHELQRHMEITEMGTCAGKEGEGCGDECSDKMMDTHFFYFAFENSVCKGYISEKFWNIKRLIVPVVLSRRVLDNNLTVPQGAFIAADDFNSAEEMAAHLKKVAADKELYMSYLQWTREFKRSRHNAEVLNPLCRLCKFALEQQRSPGSRRTQIADIVAHWEDDGQCRDRFAEVDLFKGKTRRKRKKMMKKLQRRN